MSTSYRNGSTMFRLWPPVLSNLRQWRHLPWSFSPNNVKKCVKLSCPGASLTICCNILGSGSRPAIIHGYEMVTRTKVSYGKVKTATHTADTTGNKQGTGNAKKKKKEKTRKWKGCSLGIKQRYVNKGCMCLCSLENATGKQV